MLLRGSVPVLAAVALVACGSSSTKGEPMAPTSAAPTAANGGPATPPASNEPQTAPPDGPAPISLPGRWTPPKCGDRAYVRNLDLALGGRFKAEDRVSPCPPGKQCFWSGIVHREGNWALEGNKVTLAADKDRLPPNQGSGFPSVLEFPGAELVEVQGSERCSYTKQ